MDETPQLENDLPPEELTDLDKLNIMKQISDEIEADATDDPGDPLGVSEVDTDWAPEDDEEEL